MELPPKQIIGIPVLARSLLLFSLNFFVKIVCLRVMVYKERSFRKCNNKTGNTTIFFAYLKMNISRKFDNFIGDRVL